MKTQATRLLLAGATASAFALFTSTSQAQSGTGSLAGWNVLGDAITLNGSITVTTAFLDGAGDAAGNLSGNPAADVAAIESAAGIVPFGLDLPPDHFATEGSLVGQSFTAAAGQVLSFDWSFATRDDLFPDHAFVVIDGRLTTLATTAKPGGGLRSFAHTVARTGQVRLTSGVVDTDDFNGVSSLSIGNLQLGAVAAPVPEPSTWALFGAGLGVLGWFARRPGFSVANLRDRVPAHRRIRCGSGPCPAAS